MAVQANLALDLMLKTLVNSNQFQEISEKNWAVISRAIPGTNARQCQMRYEELMKADCLTTSANIGSASINSTQIGRSDPDRSDVKSQPETSRNKTKPVWRMTHVRGTLPSSMRSYDWQDGKSNKTLSSSKNGGNSSVNSEDQGFFRFASSSKKFNPVMVIHVCDEAKNLKQDFHCPRDLLVREMRYFAEYLSTDAQRWEEVDISVHCDVQIFDWLMKYVKRATHREGQGPPKLEASSVISILISSDFLKMDNLVEECIQFCHRNMSPIVATPCNMNCINDKLVSRISDLYNHNEADDVKDRKDKFKSKLFGKLLEKLFDPSIANSCSPESAASLFKCAVCKKVLNTNLAKRINCLPSRMIIDRCGQLAYSHTPDPSFDVGDYLIDLKGQLKTWRDVYWRIWGSINFLSCSRCSETFPCTELGQCKFHPDTPLFHGNSLSGEYPCCGLQILRFDPSQQNKGCKLRDHIVNLSESGMKEPIGSKEQNIKAKQRVYEDLLSHREAVCMPHQKVLTMTNEDGDIDVFALEEEACGIKKEINSATSSASNLGEDATTPVVPKPQENRPQPRLQALTVEREVTNEDLYESDDEVGDDEDSKPKKQRHKRSKVTVDPQAILLGAPDFSTTRTRKWDSSRSLRWNQDCQREEDQRRMYEIVNYLTRLRVNPEKIDRLRQREYIGGQYSRLEAQWRAANTPAPKQMTSQYRNKPRISQLVNNNRP